MSDLTWMIEEAVDEYSAELEKAKRSPGIQGLLTGIWSIDEILRGVKPQSVGVIAARTGMGKTALMLNLAVHFSATYGRVGYVNLEMGKFALMNRLASNLSGIDSIHLQEGMFMAQNKVHVDKMLALLRSVQMVVNNETCGYDIKSIWAVMNEMRTAGCKVIFIDYGQLITVEKAQNKVAELEEISSQLKRFSLTGGIPLIVALQLNRMALEDKPHLGHIKGADKFAADADWVGLLHKEQPKKKGKYDDEVMEEVDERAYEFIVDKNRHGRTGVAKLSWDEGTTTFRSAE